MWHTIRMMKHIFPKAARSCHPAIGIGIKLHTLLDIAHWMPWLSRVKHIMVINGGTILSLRRSLDIGIPAEGSFSTAMILFSSTAGLWMHGKIAAHSRVSLQWIES